MVYHWWSYVKLNKKTKCLPATLWVWFRCLRTFLLHENPRTFSWTCNPWGLQRNEWHATKNQALWYPLSNQSPARQEPQRMDPHKQRPILRDEWLWLCIWTPVDCGSAADWKYKPCYPKTSCTFAKSPNIWRGRKPAVGRSRFRISPGSRTVETNSKMNHTRTIKHQIWTCQKSETSKSNRSRNRPKENKPSSRSRVSWMRS